MGGELDEDDVAGGVEARRALLAAERRQHRRRLVVAVVKGQRRDARVRLDRALFHGELNSDRTIKANR